MQPERLILDFKFQGLVGALGDSVEDLFVANISVRAELKRKAKQTDEQRFRRSK